MRPEKNKTRGAGKLVTKKCTLGLCQGGCRWVPCIEPGGDPAAEPSDFTGGAPLCYQERPDMGIGGQDL